MERSFKRIYIEITNICNLSCPFCPPLRRERRIMEPRAFSHILKEIGPTCKNILLHVKGEPLLSPYLPEILSLCEEKGFFVTLTTNGVLLSERAPLLCERAPAIRGVNWSLQSFVHFDGWRGLFEANLAFCEKLALEYGKTAVLRLWGGRKEAEIKELLLKLAARFHLPEEEMGSMEKKRNHTLAKGLFISRDDEFTWPGGPGGSSGEEGFCYGSLTQLAILCDGRVVPCCLDAEGEMPLGNIFEEPFQKILAGGRLKRMREGFSQGRAEEETCRGCGYKERFSNKARRLAR